MKGDVPNAELAGAELDAYLRELEQTGQGRYTLIFNLRDGCKYDAVYEVNELLALLEQQVHCLVEHYPAVKLEGLMDLYDYQGGLTEVLDTHIERDFDQAIINEIVLWKVNRYVDANTLPNWLEMLNGFKDDIQVDEVKLKDFLECVLDDKIKGIRLAMASTFLRFRNPAVYQIIDERTYRVVMRDKESRKMLGDYAKKEDQIQLYIKYLENLRKVCAKLNIEFRDADRILYQFDIVKNGDFNQSGK